MGRLFETYRSEELEVATANAGPLTHDAIRNIKNGDVDLQPVLQVMDIRRIGNRRNDVERFRLVLSDGLFVIQAMLATRLNEYVKSKEVVKGTIVQVVEYIANTVQNRFIVIVLNLEVVQAVADIIGDPYILVSGSEQLLGGAAPGVQEQEEQDQGSSTISGRAVSETPQLVYPLTGNGWESYEARAAAGPQADGGGFANTGNGVRNGNQRDL